MLGRAVVRNKDDTHHMPQFNLCVVSSSVCVMLITLTLNEMIEGRILQGLLVETELGGCFLL